LTAEGRDYIEQHFENPYPTGKHPLNRWLGADALGSQYVR
jgi:hypothetical protein